MWVGLEWDENMVATKGEWQDYFGQPAVFSIPGGQSVTISATSGIGVQAAGQVPEDAVEFTMADGNNFTGNPFPAELDIQNIKLIGSGGWGTELFSVWEGLPIVVEGSEFIWVGLEWDENMVATKGEWQDYFGQSADFKLKPFQGCVINGTAGLKIEITPPYSLEK